jgi:hypothetical protein
VPKPFGTDRYYSHPSPPEHSSAIQQEASQFFQEILEAVHARRRDQTTEEALEELEEQVLTAESRWNVKTRTRINVETKLTLTHEGQQESIPVRVKGGVPPPLARLYKEQGDPVLWRLILERPTLETTLHGLNVVLDSFWELTSGRLQEKFSSLKKKEATEKEFENVGAFIEALLDELKNTKIQRDFQGISEDILGAYHFRVPVIHLYWIPIVLVAGILNVPAESLAAVTLLHERAHAYTHRGFDVDGNQWPTENFAEADLPVIEGLAQYYTWSVCVSMEEEYPSLLRAFNRLVQLQPPSYKAFWRWAPLSERAGEVIRGAMITARARPVGKMGEFEEILENIRAQQQGEE